MVELIGWERLEMKSLLAVDGVTEENFGSMLGRTLTLKMGARFPTNPSHVKPAHEMFLPDDDLKEFLGGGPAALAGLRGPFGSQASTTLSDARGAIERYLVADPTTEPLSREDPGLEPRHHAQPAPPPNYAARRRSTSRSGATRAITSPPRSCPGGLNAPLRIF